MIDPAIVAVAGTALGGIGLKITENLLSRDKDKKDYAIQLREELRVELRDLKAEKTALERELDEWKDKYYSLLSRFINVETQIETLSKGITGGQGLDKPPGAV